MDAVPGPSGWKRQRIVQR